MILQLICGAATSWLLYSLICLTTNVQRAQALGIQWKALPVSPMNVLWAVLEIPVFRVLDRLPLRFGSFSRYNRRAWHFKEKANSHIELGDAFTLVTPGELWIYISDPDAIVDTVSRRADFQRPLHIYRKRFLWSSAR